MTTEPAPTDAAAAEVSPLPATVRGPAGWRKRHPVLARTLLYGGLVAVLGGGVLVGRRLMEDARQTALLTRIQGAEGLRESDPEGALRILREEVLAKEPNDDVRRRALLAQAAVLDSGKRYDEADAVYARVEADWPADTPRGPLYVPWANLRVSAGRPADALALLDRARATEGWPPDSASFVRERARKALELQRAGTAPEGAPKAPPPPSQPPRSGGG